MSDDDYSETVTNLIASRKPKWLVEAKPNFEYPPTVQNPPDAQPLSSKQIPSTEVVWFRPEMVEPRKRIFEYPPTVQNPSPSSSSTSTSEAVETVPSGSQIGHQVRNARSELKVARTGKMYATIVGNVYSQLKEHRTRENYSDEEIFDMGIEIADAAEVLIALGKASDDIVKAGEQAQESAKLMDEALKMRDRASELFSKSLSLLRSMNLEQ